MADCVVLSTPHTDETEQLLDRAAIAAMKPGAVLINIARGLVVDETAMIEALQSGQIGFRGARCGDEEPLDPASPLGLTQRADSAAPASTAYRENERILEIFIHNLRCYLDGRIDEMTPVIFDKQRLDQRGLDRAPIPDASPMAAPTTCDVLRFVPQDGDRRVAVVGVSARPSRTRHLQRSGASHPWRPISLLSPPSSVSPSISMEAS